MCLAINPQSKHPKTKQVCVQHVFTIVAMCATMYEASMAGMAKILHIVMYHTRGHMCGPNMCLWCNEHEMDMDGVIQMWKGVVPSRA